MSALLDVAIAANRLGFGSLVAKAASLAYRRSNFWIDEKGRWVNQQAEATFVSPIVHTTAFAEARRWVLDNWAWGYRPQPGDVVIDVGAGIGEEAVVFSKMVGATGRVISVEAHPHTFSCLRRTIELSRLTNITALCCAVSDLDGELFISDVDSHLSNSVVNQTSGTKVKAQTLESIANDLGLEEIALIKMNIEGAEKLAVGGMAAIAPRVRNAVISCHDFVSDFYGGGEHLRTRDYVRAALEDQGFQISTRPDAAESWMRDYLYASR